MSSFDLINMALRNLWKRKLRTFLTVLGVVIGTASIVVMISIGIGMNESYAKQAEEWGSLQVIDVYAPYNSGSRRGNVVMIGGSSNSSSNASSGKEVVINREAIEKFKAIDGVEAASPVVQDYIYLICGKYVTDLSVKGIEPQAMEALGYKAEQGRVLEEGDKNSVVLGGEILNNFYNPKLTWEQRYSSPKPEVDVFTEKTSVTYDYNYGTKHADRKISPIKVEVVGVMAGTGQDSYSGVMPLKTLEGIISEKEKYENSMSGGGSNNASNNKKKKGLYDAAMVKAKDMNEVQRIQQELKDMGYEASSLTDFLEQMKETSKMLRMMLGAIGAVSLVVAAIGITNTMVMAIYERTREIGVMKVIGASLKDIKRLFLTEAAFIGFSGGLIGVGISMLLSKVVNYFAVMQQSDMLSSIPIWLCGASLLFATFVGVSAGYFPAVRAMKLSALAAIKAE